MYDINKRSWSLENAAQKGFITEILQNSLNNIVFAECINNGSMKITLRRNNR